MPFSANIVINNGNTSVTIPLATSLSVLDTNDSSSDINAFPTVPFFNGLFGNNVSQNFIQPFIQPFFNNLSDNTVDQNFVQNIDMTTPFLPNNAPTMPNPSLSRLIALLNLYNRLRSGLMLVGSRIQQELINLRNNNNFNFPNFPFFNTSSPNPNPSTLPNTRASIPMAIGEFIKNLIQRALGNVPNASLVATSVGDFVKNLIQNLMRNNPAATSLAPVGISNVVNLSDEEEDDDECN